MAELADALDLGSSAVKGVQVQVLFPAPALRSVCQFVQETLAFLAVSCSFLMSRAMSPSGTSGAGVGITSHRGRSPLLALVEKCPIKFWLEAMAVCEARCTWPEMTNGEVAGALVMEPPTCAMAPVPQNAHTTDR